jgi:hypothetical protein
MTPIKEMLSSFEERRKYTSTVAWAIPSDEAIKSIQTFAGGDTILEIGAGLGYWAMLLKEQGVNNIPTDNKEMCWKHSATPTYIPVIRKRHLKALSSYPEVPVLFLCWPPYNTPMADEALNAFKGNKVIYIGEDEGGCNADGNFFNLLEEKWKLNKCVFIPQWYGLHDRMFLYERIASKAASVKPKQMPLETTKTLSRLIEF